MKIVEEFTSYTGDINIGKLAKFFVVGGEGAEISNDELFEKIKHFSNVVFLGNPFYSKTEIQTLINKVLKVNSDIQFIIQSDSLIKPSVLGKFSNIIYMVNIPLKKVIADIDKRINKNAVKWFIEIGANFTFDVETEDDIDEILELINMFELPKKQVYIFPVNPEKLNYFMKLAFKNNLNISLHFRELLWNNFGRN